MLSRQLPDLEADGLMHSEVYREVPLRVEYSRTQLGPSLVPILINLRGWGVAYEQYLGEERRFTGEEYESPESLQIRPHCKQH